MKLVKNKEIAIDRYQAKKKTKRGKRGLAYSFITRTFKELKFLIDNPDYIRKKN